MSRSSPFVISLSEADRTELQRRARCYTAPHAEVVRAKIVLLAAVGMANTAIAARLDVHVGVVSRWRRRFAGMGWTVWQTGGAAAGRGCSPPRWSPRSR
jgi:Homeodomain-like domain